MVTGGAFSSSVGISMGASLSKPRNILTFPDMSGVKEVPRTKRDELLIKKAKEIAAKKGFKTGNISVTDKWILVSQQSSLRFGLERLRRKNKGKLMETIIGTTKKGKKEVVSIVFSRSKLNKVIGGKIPPRTKRKEQSFLGKDTVYLRVKRVTKPSSRPSKRSGRSRRA